MKIGQKAYLKPLAHSNAIRRNKSIRESVVEKVGRIYITVAGYGRFYIKNGRQKTDFSADYRLFLDKQELYIKIESEDLADKIRYAIPQYGSWDLEIDKLRQIANILGVEADTLK